MSELRQLAETLEELAGYYLVVYQRKKAGSKKDFERIRKENFSQSMVLYKKCVDLTDMLFGLLLERFTIEEAFNLAKEILQKGVNKFLCYVRDTIEYPRMYRPPQEEAEQLIPSQN